MQADNASSNLERTKTPVLRLMPHEIIMQPAPLTTWIAKQLTDSKDPMNGEAAVVASSVPFEQANLNGSARKAQVNSWNSLTRSK